MPRVLKLFLLFVMVAATACAREAIDPAEKRTVIIDRQPPMRRLWLDFIFSRIWPAL